MRHWTAAALEQERQAGGRSYLEFSREPALSAGLYTLAAGALDGQSPHTKDEIYVVFAGRARFTAGGATEDLAPGDTL